MEEIAFLLLTIAIELPIAMVFLQKADWKRGCLVLLFMNMISHPIAWQLVSARVPWLTVEIGVTVFEGVIFALFFPRTRLRAALGAISANVVSALVGKIFF